MDIRCGNCNKLFRVADEKISGKGIRFKCSRCAETITITREDFEKDLIARQAAAGGASQEQTAQPARPVPPPSPPQPPAQEFQPREYQPQEYQPPDETPRETPPAALSDFDFSEPHAAAVSADQGGGEFGGADFSFNADAEQQPAPEISLSGEAAANAESPAFQFPTDIISEPQRQPAFAAPEQPEGEIQNQSDSGESLNVPDLGGLADTGEPEPPRAKKPKAPPAAPSTAGDEIDLAAALSVPREPERSGKQAPKTTRTSGSLNSAAVERERPSAVHEDIHPLASGNSTGAIAGIGCAAPIVAILSFSFGMAVKMLPFLSEMPLVHLLAVIAGGLVSIGLVLGILIALIQAGAGKKLFFLVNIMIGTALGAAIGAGLATSLSLLAGGGIRMTMIASNAINGAGAAFLVSILLALVRRILVFTKDETFSASLSGMQKVGLALSLFVILGTVYGAGTLVGKTERAAKETIRKYQELLTPDGLEVVDPNGYFDPKTHDLIVTGSVRNVTDKPKRGWYLVTDVYNDKQAKVATVRMLNGVQLYTKSEYEILAKRGDKNSVIKAMQASSAGAVIPARGSVQFEVRVVDPPAGSASFLPTLQSGDPESLARSIAGVTGGK